MRKYFSRHTFTRLIEGDGKILVLLAVVIWIGRFWHSQDFGLYADDYTRVPLAMGMTFSELWNSISEFFTQFTAQGRPFHPSFIFFFSYLGGKLDGLFTIYLFGYVLLLTNAFLFYKLLNRLHGSEFAIMGTLALCLFTADTTQIYLTHLFGMEPSLLFFILATLSYLSGKRFLSYLFITASLITYETLFPVFFIVPLLGKKWDSNLIREFIKHSLILFVLFLVDYLLRAIFGGSILSNLDFPDMITIPLVHMFQGPIVSVGTFFYRPIQTILAMDTELVMMLIVFFPLVILLLSRLKMDHIHETIPIKRIFYRRSFSSLSENWRNLLKLAFLGLIMLILAYPLTFTVRAYAISGRDTRVHFAAVVGASILFASISLILMNLVQRGWLKHLLVSGLAAFITLWMGFGLVVQKDYVLSWQYQRAFWSDLVSLIPDVSDGTVILVDPEGLEDIQQIDANTWNLPRVLQYIYTFPTEWEVIPRVYRLMPGWEKRTGVGESLFQVNDANVVAAYYFYTIVESSHVIIIETDGDELSRRVEPLIAGGVEYPLKLPDGSEVQVLEKGVLFDYLICSGG
jgi:hypothetical protein